MINNTIHTQQQASKQQQQQQLQEHLDVTDFYDFSYQRVLLLFHL